MNDPAKLTFSEGSLRRPAYVDLLASAFYINSIGSHSLNVSRSQSLVVHDPIVQLHVQRFILYTGYTTVNYSQQISCTNPVAAQHPIHH